MENPENYVQTWNSRSKKYVLIKRGTGGKMTGKMQPEPFEGVEIVNPKPKPEKQEDSSQPESQPSDTSLEPGQNEQEETQQEEKPEKQSNWASIFGF